MGRIRDALSHARSSMCQRISATGASATMASPEPAIPQKWYFYNLKQSIDDPYKPFSVAALDSISSRVNMASSTSCDTDLSGSYVNCLNPTSTESDSFFSQTTMRKTISPVVEWIPFNPSDNARLCANTQADSPIAVGHDRLLFEVNNLSTMRPIYWSIQYSTKVTATHWVFLETMTPIDPCWDEAVMSHFLNFRENIATYKEMLKKSQADPVLMKVIAQRLKLNQSGRLLSVDLLFSPENSMVYIFKADSSYIYTRKTSISLMNGETPRGVLAVLAPFDFGEYKKCFNVPDRLSDDPNYVPMPINNLILVFHGIGQKLSTNYTRVNFVYAIDKLRVEILKATESQEVHNHFPKGSKAPVRTLVLAVNWRTAIDSENNLNVDNITVKSLMPIRQAFSDAMLDIPLYMSENRRPAMLAAAANEANRIYDLVLQHHPTFLQNGRTHVVGHSLGSLITADLLTHQPTSLTDSDNSQAPFKFQTSNYFITGSMLGVFMLLKNKRLIPRQEFEEKYGCDVERPFGCFAVENIYNIIHQSDLLSFLVNLTVEGAENPSVENLTGKEGYPLEADELPISPEGSMLSNLATATGIASSNANVAKEILERDSPDEFNKDMKGMSGNNPAQGATALKEKNQPGSKEDATINKDTTATTATPTAKTFSQILSSSFSRFTKFDVSKSTVDEEYETIEDVPNEIKDLIKRLEMLNDNGQIDWKIPQQASYIPSHYLKMFTAHFDYWSNREIARFLAIECAREPGVDNTIPEHRAKWTFKKKRSK